MSPALLLIAVLATPFPLAPGTWWEYRESYTETKRGVDSTTDDVTRFSVRGPIARPFIVQTGGVDPVSGPVERGEDWIRLSPWTGDDRLPLPLEPGRAAVDEGGVGWRVEDVEPVTVPAGTFDALRCAFRTRTQVSILWIAREVGIVRETQGRPGAHPEIDRVLLRWSGAAARPRER